MARHAYVRNYCFRIPGSTTRSRVGTSIEKALIEHVWGPYLTDADGDGVQVETVKGDFGVTRVLSLDQYRRDLRARWMRTDESGNRIDVVGQTYPGNTFNVAFHQMLREDTLSAREAAAVEKAAATYTNFIPPEMEPSYQQMAREAEAEEASGESPAADPFGDEPPGLPDGVPAYSEVSVSAQLAASGKPDDLALINGVNKSLAAKLVQAGFGSFVAIAEADPDEIASKVSGIGYATASRICQQASNLVTQQVSNLSMG